MAHMRKIIGRGKPIGPVPFSENDPNLRVYGPAGEVDPVAAVRREKRHQEVRKLQGRGMARAEIATQLRITEEQVEESLDPDMPEGRPGRPGKRPGRPDRPRPRGLQ